MGLFSFFKKDKDNEKKADESFSLIQIDAEKCGGCGRCVSVCPNNAYELMDGKSTLRDNYTCRNCKVCLAACSSNAIEFSN